MMAYHRVGDGANYQMIILFLEDFVFIQSLKIQAKEFSS